MMTMMVTVVVAMVLETATLRAITPQLRIFVGRVLNDVPFLRTLQITRDAANQIIANLYICTPITILSQKSDTDRYHEIKVAAASFKVGITF